MANNTPRFSLNKQDKGVQNWHTEMNLNFDRIDANVAHRYHYSGEVLYFHKTAEGNPDYERVKLYFDMPNNEFKIEGENAGAGVARNMAILPASGVLISRSIFPDVNGSRNLGDGNARWARINVNDIWYGTVQVSIGANDSGGAGFRVLRIPN